MSSTLETLGKAVPYSDLLALQYRDGELDPASGFIDCLGAALEVARRAGGRPAGLWPGPFSGDHWDALGHSAVEGAGPWRRVGDRTRDARRLGDVILTYGHQVDGEKHFATWALVATAPPTVLTATRDRGVFALGRGRIPASSEVRGVYRLEALP